MSKIPHQTDVLLVSKFLWCLPSLKENHCYRGTGRKVKHSEDGMNETYSHSDCSDFGEATYINFFDSILLISYSISRMVNTCLAEELKEIHAFEQKTLTPEQWEKQKAQWHTHTQRNTHLQWPYNESRTRQTKKVAVFIPWAYSPHEKHTLPQNSCLKTLLMLVGSHYSLV